LPPGIGANTAMFSVVRGAPAPLPYAEPDPLCASAAAARPDLRDLTAQSRACGGFAGYRPQFFDVPGEPLAERLDGALVAGDALGLLGTKPALGRLLTADDDHVGAEKVVVVSDRFWRQRLGADPAAVGRTFRFVTGTYRIAGVLPAGFELPEAKADVYASQWPESPPEAEARGAHTLLGLARVRPGVTLAQAQRKRTRSPRAWPPCIRSRTATANTSSCRCRTSSYGTCARPCSSSSAPWGSSSSSPA
jgi:hypothetical protein